MNIISNDYKSKQKDVSLIAIGNGNVRMANAFVEELKFEGELYTDPELHSYKALNFKVTFRIPFRS